MRVKEYLYEKFEEESDPIRDMGIGMPPEKILANLSKLSAVECGKKYFPSIKDKEERTALGNALYDFFFMKVQHKVDDVWAYESAISDVCRTYDLKSETYPKFKKVVKNKFGIEIGHSILLDEDDDDEIVVEAFTGDSDVISDMGIGMVRKNIKDLHKFQQMFGIGAINLVKAKDALWLQVDSYTSSFNAFMQNVHECFGKNIFEERIKSETFGKSFRSRYSLSIKPEYQEMFLQSFNKHGFVKVMNEKFGEDLDPIRDMGIGIFVPKTFKGINDYHRWLYAHLKDILDIEDLKEILKYKGEYLTLRSGTDFLINDDYFKILKKYTDDFITILDVNPKDDFPTKFFPSIIRNLILMDYPELKAEGLTENLNEKFEEEDFDPIEDMGIGMFEFDVECSGEYFEGKDEEQKRATRRWRGDDGIKVLKVKGKIEDETSELAILLNGPGDDPNEFEMITFDYQYCEGSMGQPSPNDVWQLICLKSEPNKVYNVEDVFMDEINSTMAMVVESVLNLYWKIKRGVFTNYKVDPKQYKTLMIKTQRLL